MTSVPIVDVEASGLHFDSYPIEIAVLAQDDVISWLILPQPSWKYWSPVAEGMHGISRAMLQEQGTSALEVARELNTAVKALGGVLYSDAAEWDLDWIRTLYLSAETVPEFDVLPIQQLLSLKQQQRFSAARQQLERSGRYRIHRAGPDVSLIYEAYCHAVHGKAILSSAQQQ